jgi:hypothetical protein
MKLLFAKANSLIKIIVEKIITIVTMSIYFIVGIFAMVIFLILPFSKLADLKFDTLPITNYCFAIMGGCASICFSWSRNVDQLNKRLVNQISYCGERSFLAAVSFVLASALRYFTINKAEYFNKASSTTVGIMQLVAVISLFISLILGFSAFYYILKLLSKHITGDEKFDEL